MIRGQAHLVFFGHLLMVEEIFTRFNHPKGSSCLLKCGKSNLLILVTASSNLCSCCSRAILPSFLVTTSVCWIMIHPWCCQVLGKWIKSSIDGLLSHKIGCMLLLKQLQQFIDLLLELVTHDLFLWYQIVTAPCGGSGMGCDGPISDLVCCGLGDWEGIFLLLTMMLVH